MKCAVFWWIYFTFLIYSFKGPYFLYKIKDYFGIYFESLINFIEIILIIKNLFKTKIKKNNNIFRIIIFSFERNFVFT